MNGGQTGGEIGVYIEFIAARLPAPYKQILGENSSKYLKFNTPVDDRSAIFWDGQEYGHFFGVDDRSAIFGGGRPLGHFWGWTTGVLNFRDFEEFFSSQIGRVGLLSPMNSI